MKPIIKILGTSCPKCKNLYKLTKEVLDENQIEATIIKVEDIMEIMNYNIMSTPALMVDDKIVSIGRVPSKQDILQLIQTITIAKDSRDTSCCNTNSCC